MTDLSTPGLNSNPGIRLNKMCTNIFRKNIQGDAKTVRVRHSNLRSVKSPKASTLSIGL